MVELSFSQVQSPQKAVSTGHNFEVSEFVVTFSFSHNNDKWDGGDKTVLADVD